MGSSFLTKNVQVLFAAFFLVFGFGGSTFASSLTLQPDYGNIPLYFIENQGQVAEQARFYAKTPGYTLWVTSNGLVFDSGLSRTGT